jgi:hypothetical protein
MTVSLDQTVRFQAGEMLGHLRLRPLEDLLEMADAKCPPGQEVQNPQARLVSEALVNSEQAHE